MNLSTRRITLRAALAVFLLGTVIIGGTAQASWLIGVFSAEVEQRLEAQAELPALLINAQQVWADLVEDPDAMRRLIGAEHRESLVIGNDGRIVYATRPTLRQAQIRDIPDTLLGHQISELIAQDLGLQPCSGLVQVDDQRLLHLGRIHPTKDDPQAAHGTGRTVAWLAVVLDRSGLEAQRQALMLRMALGLAALLAIIVPLAWLGLDRFIIRRISTTVEVLESFAAGAASRRLATPPTGGDEIAVLQRGTNAALDQIAARTEDLRQAHRDLEAANADLERRVEERTRDLRAAQAQLVQAAHANGRAEVAIGVLHNIGTEVNGLGSILHRLAPSDDALPRILQALGDQAAQEGTTSAPLLRSLAEMAGQRSAEQVLLGRRLTEHQERILHLITAHQGLIAGPPDLAGMVSDPVADVITEVLAEFPDLPRSVTVPPDLTWRVPRILATETLSNLVRNACAASAGRGIRIIAGPREPGLVGVTVEDDGQGLDAQGLRAAFRPDLIQRQPGSLGLHDQVNRLRRLGGDLVLESDGPGRGCRATMVAPGGAA